MKQGIWLRLQTISKRNLNIVSPEAQKLLVEVRKSADQVDSATANAVKRLSVLSMPQKPAATIGIRALVNPR